MFRLVIRCSNKLSLVKNSRSLQSSSILKSEKNEVKENEEKFDAKYWETECEQEHPIGRTCRVMSKQFRQMKNKLLFWREPRPVDQDEWNVDSANFPSHVDVVIIGSGAIANSIAYWIKKRNGESFSTVIIENGDKYNTTSPVLHASGFRLQNSLDENVEMALFSAEFIREANEYLSIENEPKVNVPFHHEGFLNLATEAGAEQLEFNSKFQNSLGIKNVILSPEKMNIKFPWLNTDGIALGCLGLEKEGWFNPYYLTQAMRRKSLEMGVEYVTAEVKGFIISKMPNTTVSSQYLGDLYNKLNHVVVKTIDGRKKVIQFSILVIAAGHESSNIARMTKIGEHSGILSVPLPIERRKRYLYTIDAPEGPGINTPITQDPSGFFFRRHGLVNQYMVGFTPQHQHEEPDESDLKANSQYFYDVIWPKISHRVPSFETVDVKLSQAAFLDYNTFDETGIIGQHPLYTNVLFATGFGHNSVNYSPAIGRGISELIGRGGYVTLNLNRLSFERFITQEPQKDAKIL